MTADPEEQPNVDETPNQAVSALDAIANTNSRVVLTQCVLGVIAYALMLGGPLFFDDRHFITYNTHVTSFDLAEIYTSSVTEGVGVQSNTYRPNQQLTYAVLYHFFGEASLPYHLVSLAVHITNSFLVFLLLVKLSLGRTGSLVASLVFLLHPVQTQAVSYVSGLAGPLELALLLAGIHAWIASLEPQSGGRRAGLFALALLFFVEAAFTKSNVVIVAPLTLTLAAYLLLTGRVERCGYLFASVGAFFAFACGFMALKLTVLNFAETGGMIEGANIYTESLSVRLFTFVSVLDRYLEMIVFPAALSYSKPKIVYSSLMTWHGIAGIFVIAAGLFALVRAKAWPTVFLGCGWFFAALAPFSGVIPLTSMYLEHWLYIPLVGVVILVAALYRNVDAATRNNVALIALIVLALMLARTVNRNYDWADPERFYVADMKVAGKSIQMFNNLAIYLMSIGDNDRAMEVLNTVIAANDSAPEPHDNLARIYLERGDFVNAKAEFLRALEIDPQNRNSLMGLRSLYDRRGETGEAMKIEQRIRAIERDERL